MKPSDGLITEKLSLSPLWLMLKGYQWPFLAILTILVFWEITAILTRVNEILLPRPSKVFIVMVTQRAILLKHMWITLYEILVGFVLAVGVGIGMAIGIAHSDILKKMLYPLLVASQNIPKVAIGPLFVIWMGMGIASKALLVFLICFFPIVVNTATGLVDVPQEMIDLLRSLNASKAQILWKIRLPNAFPYIISGMKISITLAVVGAIVGEFIAANQGLGFLILLTTGSFNTPMMMAAIGVLVLVGMILFEMISMLPAIFTPWRKIPEGQPPLA